MKVTINTEILKDMVARAIKGSGNNKLIPITSLMAIEIKNNKLTLITTDATHYLYIIEDKVIADDFYAVVDANTFAKLVSKFTCETVELQIRDNIWVLEVKGNGNYKIELPLDENGLPIKYPDPYEKLALTEDTDAGIINKSVVNVILETIKPALAITMDEPCYTGYYVGKQVVATDSYKIASMDIELFKEPKLVSSELLDLLAVMKNEKIAVDILNNDVVFSTEDCIIVGKFMEDIEDYQIGAIMELVDMEISSHCTVSKGDLLRLLDRLALFVGPYDKNAIHLAFTSKGLQISSKESSGIELIEYVKSEDFRDFSCYADIQMILTEVKAIQSDVIDIYYGDENAIKLKDGNITIVVALMDDEDI